MARQMCKSQRSSVVSSPVAAVAVLAILCGTPAVALAAGEFSWVVGVNYVPSTAHNDVATWQDYNATQVANELRYAAASGFNVVRVFLHSLPWLFNATAFKSRLAQFVATLEATNLTSQLVLFDSCFGDINADLSWITSGRYKNSTWIPNPGPAAVANISMWPVYDAYVADVLSVVGSSPAVLLWDVMNEPAFADGPDVVAFIAHMSSLVASKDIAGRLRTVGIASSSQQVLVQGHVSLLSFHNYDGGGSGAALAQDILGQQELGRQLGLPVLLTESMSRPTDPLSGVLPAVYGCFNDSGGAEKIGWFVWELMLGVDQFNYNWASPYQGLVYPAWGGGPSHAGGTFWAPSEQALLQAYRDGCPVISNGSFIPDTDSLWSYSPPLDWTAWQGQGPRNGTLHYANTAGSVATLGSPDGLTHPVSALTLVFKVGPDCGKMAVSLNGALLYSSFDTYAPTVNWGSQLVLGLTPPSRTFVLDVEVTGESNPLSSNAWVQIVGASLILAPNVQSPVLPRDYRNHRQRVKD